MSSWVVRTAPKGFETKYQVRLEERVVADVADSACAVTWVASALNHRDNWITKGMYPGIKSGVVLGSDGVAILNSKVGALPAGCRVLIDPSIGWPEHSTKAPGPSLGILGMPTDGTFTRGVSYVPRKNVRKCPQHLSDVEAAALPLAGVTAYRAMFTKGECASNSSVLITGVGGGVALMALQFGIACGAKVYVTSSSDEKIARAMRLGAKGGANYKTDDEWLKSFDFKFDLVVDGAGGSSVSKLIRLIKPGGVFVSYGATTGPIKSLNLAPLFLNQIEIRGTSMGSPEDFESMLSLVEEHKIRPIVHETFEFEDFPKALEVMRNGSQFGKLVLRHSINSQKL